MLKLLFTSLILITLLSASSVSAEQNARLTGGYTDASLLLSPLDYIDLEALGASSNCCGVAFVDDTDRLWITDAGSEGGAGDSNVIHLITLDGVLVSTFEQDETTGWGLRDLCWDGQYVYGSESNEIDYYDDATCIKQGSFLCYACSPCRALAWDGTYFYTGSFSEAIYRVNWDGVSGSTATFVTWSSSIYNGGTYGAAVDLYNDCLWVSTWSGDSKIYQLDLEDGTLIAEITYTIPQAGGCSPGAIAAFPWYYKALWVLDIGPPCALHALDLYPTALERETWGAIKTIF